VRRSRPQHAMPVEGRAAPVRLQVLILGALLLSLPAGCRPLYLPPVPEPLVLAERFELDGSARVVEGRPSLTLLPRTVPDEGWLAIQWFAPNNREVASESRWLAPGDAGRSLMVVLPADVEAAPGRWRAIVSRGGVVVRQLSVMVPGE
jgi:hypothetical protein